MKRYTKIITIVLVIAMTVALSAPITYAANVACPTNVVYTTNTCQSDSGTLNIQQILYILLKYTCNVQAKATAQPGTDETVKPTATPTATPAATVKPTATPAATVKPTATPTATPAATVKPTATPTATPAATVKPTATPTATPAATVKPTATPSVTPPPATGLTSTQNDFIQKTNNERGKAGMTALQVDVALCAVAQEKARDMAANGYFSHTSPTYGSPYQMMTQFGISYRAAGENLAKTSSVDRAITGLMNSEGHRKNILSSTYSHIGVGISGSYYVQMFIKK